jgi:hypothetical protein
VYRPDAEGNVNLVDTIKQGVKLVRAAENILEDGFSMSDLDDAKMLLGGATDFFNGLHHHRDQEVDEDGLAVEKFEEHWEMERKDVWMFSGCADDQTSVDTSIAGAATGAMSWALVRTLRKVPEQSYINVCLIRYYLWPIITDFFGFRFSRTRGKNWRRSTLRSLSLVAGVDTTLTKCSW